MHASSSLKQEFLNKWAMGLKICHSSEGMSLMERKRAIKVSADVAMASTRNPKTSWSRSLLGNACKEDKFKPLVSHVLGPHFERLKKISNGSNSVRRKILRRSRTICRARKRAAKVVSPSSVAKRLMKKKAKMLKSLIPGGDAIDELSLIEETLDYIISLRTQVEVMQRLANASDLQNPK